MYLLYLKAFHIIGVIVWFSGLFYLGRLFVYHKDTYTLSEPERETLKKQYSKMEKTLYYGIAWPGLWITITFGLAMLTEWGIPNWIQLKFALVILLVGYHFWCGSIRKKLSKKDFKWNSLHLRLFNEIPTILLISIVFVVVFKESLSWTILLLIIFTLGIVIYLTTRALYLKKNNSSTNHSYVHSEKK